MNEFGFFLGLGLVMLALVGTLHTCERLASCKDEPLEHGCSHPEQRYTVVDGEKMCLCPRDGGAK